jgi:N-acyl-L-homoserine lactone synthetase
MNSSTYRCEVLERSRIEDALGVRRRVYMEEFGFDLGGHGPQDALDEKAHHMVARDASGQAVASLRLIDGPDRPFEIEEFLDLSPYLNYDSHPAEITRLCIVAEHRRITRASFVHLAMLEGVLRLARDLGVTHLVASTRDELMSFYQYLLFETFAGVTYQHPEIGNATHTLMLLDLRTFKERCRRERPTLFEVVASALGGEAGHR